MEEITVPVPSDRFTDFFALYAAWLAAPAGATWAYSAPSVPTVQGWDSTRAGEAEKASELWQALGESQRTTIDAVAVSGKIEAAQIATVLSLTGSVAVIQEIVAINEVARKLGRTNVFTVSIQANQPVVELDSSARKVLLREA